MISCQIESLPGGKAQKIGEEEKKKKVPVHPQNKLSSASASVAAPKRAPVLLPGSPEVRGGKVQPLYVSRFRKVGDEGYHYSDVDAGAYGDGEGGEEESASGGDVGQREVTFVHRLGGLERRKKKPTKNKGCQKYFF